MIAILVIIGVVGAVSLYDFLNTRNWQQVTSKIRNEAVFENRNRQYGAYKIRRDYNRNFLLILLGVTGGVGVIYGAASSFREPVKAKKHVITATWDTTEMIIEKDDEPKIDVEPAKPQPVQPLTEIVRFDENIAVNNKKQDIKPPVVDTSTTVGNINQKGIKSTGFTPPGLPPVTGTPGGTGDETKEKPFTIADLDEVAEYIGGAPARNLFLQKNLRFPEIPREEGRGGKSYIKFVVTKTGDVEEASIARKNPNCPECDKEALRVVKLMPKWKPGKRKGKDVDSWFNLPLTFEVKDN